MVVDQDNTNLNTQAVLLPKTDLIVENQAGASLIGCHLGVCRAVELNDTGYAVWKLIDGNKSIGEISAALSSSLPASDRPSIEVVSLDVENFIKELLRQGLVELQANGQEQKS
jgi:hypothetical protein